MQENSFKVKYFPDENLFKIEGKFDLQSFDSFYFTTDEVKKNQNPYPSNVSKTALKKLIRYIEKHPEVLV